MLRLWTAAVCIALASAGTCFFGGSGSGDAQGATALIQSGASHARVYLLWRYVQEEVTEIDGNLTVAQLKADPSLIASWAAGLDWSGLDGRVGLYDDSNVTLIGEVTEGTLYGMPKYKDTVFDPNVVPEEQYLAYVYRQSRATVARYKHRIHIWQCENELNEAWIASLGGQRRFQFFDSKWRDFDFLTRLLSTIRDAVKDEDPSAQVTMNFHTDVAEWVHRTLLLKGYYEEAVTAWSDLVDIVALDAYPNMYVAFPCLSNLIAERIQKARAASGGKDVFLMEFSYPVDGSVAGPESANFSSANQVACIRDMYAAVEQAGGCGGIYFKFEAQTGIQPPPGGYSKLDLEALKLLRLVMSHNEDPLYLLEWLGSGLHLDYLEHRLPLLLKAVSQGFGVLQSDGTPRPAYYELQKIFTGQQSASARAF